MNKLWENMSARERRLAMGAGAMAILVICMAVGFKTVGRIRDLDHTIGALEQDLRNYAHQDARGVSVDKAFEEVKSQHSSEWNANEIFNRLRQEIYRLAQEDPEGAAGGKNLVEIPTLRQGTLKETGLGYREYQLNIKLNPVDVYSVITFCIRLQMSQQSLRIDRLEIIRAPDSEQVSATIDVTRIVVAGSGTPESGEGDTTAAATAAAGAPAEPVQQEPALVRWDGSKTDGWEGQGCDLTITNSVGDKAAAGGSCLQAVTTADEAHLFFTQELEPKATYEVAIEAGANGQAALHIMDESTGQLLQGEQALTSDGAMYRYKLQFTVPDNPNKTIKVGVPYIAMKGAGCIVYIDNVELRKL